MAYTTIDDPSAYFQALSYSGAGGSSNISRTFDGNSDLQPDLTWHKSRGQTYNHYMFDSSRGVGLYLSPNLNVGDDGTSGDTTSLASFDSDGFTLAASQGISDGSANIACFGWKANGGTRTTNTESGNNPGGGYQANTTAGFSIVDYTGTGGNGTMAHGLGKVPWCVFIKNRSSTDNEAWAIGNRGHSSSFAHPGKLNGTDAWTNTATPFNDSNPTDTVFTVGTDHRTNADGETYIAYVWAPIKGFSHFGSFLGNGLADGPFVYTGFKPAWLLIKEDENAGGWTLWNHKSVAYNPIDKILRADANEAYDTSTSNHVDFLSNGFKMRTSSGGFNEDDRETVYMAFAHQPFVSSEGISTTAR